MNLSKKISNKNNSTKKLDSNNSISYFMLFGIIILVLIIYSGSFFNNFLNGWDDDVYLTSNYDIINFSMKGLKNLCTGFYVSCYLPITMFSFVIEYKFFGMNPVAYHTTNVILHVINTVLVYIFIFGLYKKTNIALICSLFFAIHPMHVESVAWISERKDLLYSLFYLASLIYYLKFINSEKSKVKNEKLKYYVISLLLFVLSLLSKSMAVTLPVVLLLIDYYKERMVINSKFKIIRINKLSSNVLMKTLHLVQNTKLIEKIPFFILSIIFGLLTLVSQGTISGATIDSNIIDKNIIDRLFMLSYSLYFYIIKFFIPINLSAIHPYPTKLAGYLPLEYYLSILLLLVIVFLIIKSGKLRKEIIFGILFFLITISLVLMIIPVGFALVSERYTYIPYLGFFIIIGSIYNRFSDTVNTSKLSTFSLRNVILALYFISFSYLSYSRNKVWSDGKALFTDVIEKYPQSALGYYNRGRLNINELKDALEDLNKAITINPNLSTAYNNRGLLKISLNNYTGAMEDFNKAISLNENDELAWCNRGWLKAILLDYNGAINDLNKALLLNSSYSLAWINRGWVKANIKDNEGAFIDFNKAIELNSDVALAYRNRGWLKGNINDINGALEDYNKAIELNPNDDLAYNNRGNLKILLNNYKAAMDDVNKAIGLNLKNSMAYFNRGLIKTKVNDYLGALDDFNSALTLNPDYAIAYFYRGNAKLNLNELNSACKDWDNSFQKGYSDAQNYIQKYCK